MEKHKCLNCQSESLLPMGSQLTGMRKNIKPTVIDTVVGTREYLCLDCGHVTRIIPEEK